MGIVTEIFPGRDGHIRSINVKTTDGVYSRAVDHFIPLLA
jgi:hypothetical protein